MMPRLMWHEHNGYCGAAAIQAAVLEHGIYISQLQCRRFVSEMTGQEIEKAECLVHEPWSHEVGIQTILSCLGVKFNQFRKLWNSRSFIKWVANNADRTIISGLMMRNGGFHEDYDHIVLIKGVKENGLVIHDLIDEREIVTSPMKDILCAPKCCEDGWEDCKMKNQYGIPSRSCYGLALRSVAESVTIDLGRNDEPNLVMGEKPVIYDATVSVRGYYGQFYDIYRSDRTSIMEAKIWKLIGKNLAIGDKLGVPIKSDSVVDFKVEAIE